MPSGMTRGAWRMILLASLGGTLEYYDFVIFGIFARDIGQAVFPSQDPLVSLMVAFTTFAIGYLARPVGGLVLGRLGDKFGRRGVFLTSIFVTSAATLGIGIVPTYASWGIAASVIVVLLRIRRVLPWRRAARRDDLRRGMRAAGCAVRLRRRLHVRHAGRGARDDDRAGGREGDEAGGGGALRLADRVHLRRRHGARQLLAASIVRGVAGVPGVEARRGRIKEPIAELSAPIPCRSSSASRSRP